MNIAFARRVQRRILTSTQFNMRAWETCIAGHCCQEAGMDLYQLDDIGKTAQALLGIEEDEAKNLFLMFMPRDDDRVWAAERLQRLIDAHTDEPEPAQAGEIPAGVGLAVAQRHAVVDLESFSAIGAARRAEYGP